MDTTTARIYGRNKHGPRRQGYSMPHNDLWIAAMVVHYDLTLAARDTHFSWVTDLRV